MISANGETDGGVEEVQPLGVYDNLDLVAEPNAGPWAERCDQAIVLRVQAGVCCPGILLQELGVLGDHLGDIQIEVDHLSEPSASVRLTVASSVEFSARHRGPERRPPCPRNAPRSRCPGPPSSPAPGDPATTAECSARVASPNRAPRPSPSRMIRPTPRFIGGEPMNPATKMLVGLSYRRGTYLLQDAALDHGDASGTCWR